MDSSSKRNMGTNVTNMNALSMHGAQADPEIPDIATDGDDKKSYILPERPKLGKAPLDPRDTFIVLLPGEPRSSIMSSQDYSFAKATYPDGDLRRRFVDAYRENLEKASVQTYNIRFDQPDELTEILHIYVYLYEDDPEVRYRVEDPQHILITAFYDTMEQCPLPKVPLYRQILVKNIRTIMIETLLTRTYESIREAISPEFPEIRRIHVYGSLYLFVRSDAYLSLRDDAKRLAKLRKTIYAVVKKEDTDKILSPKELRLHLDDIEVYNQIGGHNYFSSEYKLQCHEF